MVRALQAFAVLTLISVGVVFVLYVFQQLQGAPEIEWNPRLSIVEKFIQAGGRSEKSSQKMLSPLVREAEAFALYLNPAGLPRSEEAPAPGSLKQTISAIRPAKLTPKSTLLATCYYRSKPEKSMALVSEPGRGSRWVKPGARLGHFVVEKVKRGAIVYRDGDRLLEMAVDKKIPVNTRQARQTPLVSGQTSTSPSRSPMPHKPRMKTHELGPQRPETRLTSFARERRGGG